MISFMSFRASIAGSLVNSNRPSGVYTFVLMLWVIGTSDRQPCESKVAPQGAAFLSTMVLAPARKSSQVANAAFGRPALLVMPECQADPVTSSRNGQL